MNDTQSPAFKLSIKLNDAGKANFVAKRLQGILDEINALEMSIDDSAAEGWPEKVAFDYRSRAPVDILTPDERAASVSFITRFEHLPILSTLTIRQEADGHVRPEEYHIMRLMLNEYRTIFFNHDDGITFKRIHTMWRQKMVNRDDGKGLVVSAMAPGEKDVTEWFVKFMGSQHKAIIALQKASDFDFIYNGVLQHAGDQYTKRLLAEYNSGEIIYTFFKNCLICNMMRERFRWHHRIVNALTFPSLGGMCPLTLRPGEGAGPITAKDIQDKVQKRFEGWFPPETKPNEPASSPPSHPAE